MADLLKDGEFCLPTEFLTDDDILLMGKDNFNGNGLRFPNQFPYELPDSESDEEDITGLTRQFSCSTLQIPQKIPFPPSNQEAKWVFSCSPQSTLCAAGSWSPPTSPLIQAENTRNMIYGAADQVTRMKMNLNNRDRPTENRALLANYAHNCVSHSVCHHTHCLRMGSEPSLKQIWGKPERERWVSPPPPPQANQRLGVENVRPMGLAQSAWPCVGVQNHRQQKNAAAMNRAVYLGGSAGGCRPVKTECAGTGVFIPRNPSEPPRRPACSTALRPAQVFHPKPLTHLIAGPLPNLSPNYELLIARRNAAMAQQQHRQNIRAEAMMKHHEVMLPQEWTY